MISTAHISSLALAYITLWILLLNTAWAVPLRLTVMGIFSQKKSSLSRCVEWLWRLVVLLWLGVFLDGATLEKPHGVYAMWEFYAMFILISMVFTLPGFWYYQGTKRRKS